MKNETFYEILGEIDEKYLVQTPAKKRISYAAWLGRAASVILIFAAVAFAVIRAVDFSRAGGLNGKINTRDPIVLMGEAYAVFDEEAALYLNGAKDSIRNTLIASGISVGDIRIKGGYSHVRTGKDGNSLAVDWRDYLIYDGAELVAIVSVTKDGSGMKHHLMFGGAWFSDYAALLEQYEGIPLVYLYIGDVEAFVLPDHSVISLMGADVSAATEDGTAYYEYFFTTYNTYTP